MDALCIITRERTIIMQLVEHRYSDKPARFYIDGVRVSRDKWEHVHVLANIQGKRLECFKTRAFPYGEGNTHRINYSCING